MKAFNALEWHIAGRYLRARRREGFISVIAVISFLGIMLGVATLIVVIAVMTGFRTDLLDRILGVNGHAIIQPYSGTFDDRQSLAAQLSSIEGVVLANPVVSGQALFSAKNGVRGVVVRGLAEADMATLPSLANSIVQGAVAGIGEAQGVMIGQRLAQIYGVNVGDDIALIAPRGTVTPFGITPKIQSFKVHSVFHLGLSEYDSSILFMPITTASDFFGIADNGGTIEVTLDNADAVGAVYPDLVRVAGQDAYVLDWRQTNSTLAGALDVERNVMFLILTLILLVAALNIVSGMVMLVRDKGRDIAVLRSMGAKRGMVMRIFFITGASIGVGGTLAGLGLGAVFCAYIEEIRQILIWLTGAELFPADVYFLDQLPAEMRTPDVLRIVGIALTLSFLSTLYPAYRAASLEPVEALRYE